MRVRWLFESIIPCLKNIYGERVDYERGSLMAERHDDLETAFIGDVQLDEKERMNSDQKVALEANERLCIIRSALRFGLYVSRFNSLEVQLEAKAKHTLLSQIVSYCDKFDGAGEAWHEVFAGNPYFLEPAGGEGNGGYIRRLNIEFPNLYPGVVPLLNSGHPMARPQRIDFASICEYGRPHTLDSIVKVTGYPPYDYWKKIVLLKEGPTQLVDMKEGALVKNIK